MTDQLRAALREIAEEIERRNFTSATAKLRALADAPPTVAELLPMVDATHEVWWMSSEGGRVFRAVKSTSGEIHVEGQRGPRWWFASSLRTHDLRDSAWIADPTEEAKP